MKKQIKRFSKSTLAVVLTLGFVWFGINTRTSHYDEHNKFLKKLWNEKVQRYITTIESAMGSTSSSESEAEQIGELLLRQVFCGPSRFKLQILHAYSSSSSFDIRDLMSVRSRITAIIRPHVRLMKGD